MSFDNPISDATQGATKGVLDWSLEKIQSLVDKFKKREITFVRDPKTIEIVREQYRSGEAKFYEIYIENKELLLLVRLGLTLRKLEKDDERIQNLRSKILKKYGVKGLHIAEFVQINTLNRYIGILIDELNAVDTLKKEIEEVLSNIEKHVLFVQAIMKKSEVVKNTQILIVAHNPSIFIVSGFKSAAKTVQDCADDLKSILKNYELERLSSEGKETLFFKRKLV